MVTESPGGKAKNSDNAATRIKFFTFTVINIIPTGIILFLSSGRPAWALAWAYLGVYTACTLATAVALSPSFLKERMKNTGNSESVKKWDTKISALITIFFWFISPLVAGLDGRFGWSGHMPLLIPVGAMAFYIIGHVLFTWAMADNNFFYANVRIQSDKGHTVAKHGPYGYIRHPGYLGMVIMYLATPLILGSFYAMIPVAAAIITLIVRTYLEDGALKEELPGYKEYSQHVRYRLLPRIW